MMGANAKELLPESWWQITRCVDAYEAACADGFPELRRLAEHVPPDNRSAAMAELAAVDMEFRWETGERKRVEQYLEELPEIQANARYLEELISQEYRIRCDCGDQPDIEEYCRRFPTHDIARIIDQTGTITLTVSSGTLAFRQLPSEPPPDRIGRYQVREEIGRGAFGRVYRCYDADLGRDVAIKVPHSDQRHSAEQRQQFLHEARSAARLRHPGIVSVLDTGELKDGRCYVVYEYVTGYTLRDRIKAGNYDRTQAIQWCAEIADALHYAHTRYVVHRDVTPANVMLDSQGHIRLGDFGLCKVNDRFYRNDRGKVLGSVAYMSPEQARGDSHWASPQADIYALGVIFYELLTQRRPFELKSPCDLEEALAEIERRIPNPPRTVDDTIPKNLESICLRAIAKNPAERFTTACDMAEALRHAATLPRELRTVRSLALIGFLLTAAAMIMVGFAWRRSDHQPLALSQHVTPQVEFTMEKLVGASLQRLRGEDAIPYLPLRTGDRIRLTAKWPLERGKYGCLLGLFPSGNRLLCAVDASTVQGLTAELIYPEDDPQPPSVPQTVNITSEPLGPEAFLLVLAEKPISKANVQSLIDAPFDPSRRIVRQWALRNREVHVFPDPESARLDSERGVGAPVRVPDSVFGPKFSERLRPFPYYQALIYWHDKPG